jgi:hypothetical protein
MARSTAPRKSSRKRLDMANAGVVTYQFVPPPEDWERIGERYGVVFTDADRASIVEVVNNYFLNHELEQSAPFVKDSLEWVKKLLKHIKKLRDHMAEGSDIADQRTRDAILRAKMEVYLGFRKVGRTDANSWGEMVGIVSSLGEAAHLAHSGIKKFDSGGGFEEGAAWRKLVADLAEFAKGRDAAFPHKAWATDSTKAPFIKFLKALQDCFPEGYSRYNETENGLAQQIKADNLYAKRWKKNERKKM